MDGFLVGVQPRTPTAPSGLIIWLRIRVLTLTYRISSRYLTLAGGCEGGCVNRRLKGEKRSVRVADSWACVWERRPESRRGVAAFPGLGWLSLWRGLPWTEAVPVSEVGEDFSGSQLSGKQCPSISRCLLSVWKMCSTSWLVLMMQLSQSQEFASAVGRVRLI